MQQSSVNYNYPTKIVEEIDGIVFSSNFDSGNLGSVKKDPQTQNKVVLSQYSVSPNNQGRLRFEWEKHQLSDLVLLLGYRDRGWYPHYVYNLQYEQLGTSVVYWRQDCSRREWRQSSEP
jgi:hypothetical protein